MRSFAPQTAPDLTAESRRRRLFVGPAHRVAIGNLVVGRFDPRIDVCPTLLIGTSVVLLEERQRLLGHFLPSAVEH